MNTLIHCLSILKIEKDTEIYRNAAELAQKLPIECAHGSNEWISAMKIIANASLTSYIFSQSQLSDFLTLAAKGLEEKRTSSEIIIFKMYRDIIENYESFTDSLKSNYPGIIIDVISVINQGMDTEGTKVSPNGLERYYQSRKHQAVTSKAEPLATTATAIHKEKITLSKSDLVESLAQITKRRRQEREQSLARLLDSVLKKISELCFNYSKLQHYSNLITKEEFKNEIQKELGKELKPYQLTRAANSIRRVQTYIENILDNKFTLDSSHGINHIKHNLEYGYQLMNLIERTRRKPRA
jgi:ATP-dependent Lon protease